MNRHPKKQPGQSQPQQLLQDQAAVRQILSDPAARKVLASLQEKDQSRLQAAAQAALKGKGDALSGILQELSRDPEAAEALETLEHNVQKL